jgi:two-component system chemotaxis response regulator CheV
MAMSNFIQSVDERTRLAGANRLEILLFSLGKDNESGREEVFGINVFKVREVMNLPAITRAPDMPPGVMGMVSLRGVMIPVIDLAHFCDVHVEDPPKILIVTEYNRAVQGFLVHSVEQILRMEWNDIKVPPSMMAHRHGGLVTAVSELNDKRIVMLLDVEKVLAETTNLGMDEEEYADIEDVGVRATVLYADDSSVARKQIETALNKMGVNSYSAKNGVEAWEKLQELASRAEAAHVPVHEMVSVILTDIEMPGMDGYVLTRKIKTDARFKGVPVVMHSSLSADANMNLGRSVGADAYVPKFNPLEFAKTLMPFLVQDHAKEA